MVLLCAWARKNEREMQIREYERQRNEEICRIGDGVAWGVLNGNFKSQNRDKDKC